MNENVSSQPLRDAYKAALAQERLLWRRLVVPDLQPVERVQAYGRWRAAVDRVKELSLQLHRAARGSASGPPAAPDALPEPTASPDPALPAAGE